jgi:hypothetical protein
MRSRCVVDSDGEERVFIMHQKTLDIVSTRTYQRCNECIPRIADIEPNDLGWRSSQHTHPNEVPVPRYQ